MHQKIQRSTEEYMLIALSFGGVLSITPFAIIRMIHGEWLMGLIDSILVLGMASLGLFVFRTGKTGAVGIILSIFALTGVAIIAYVKGPSVIYWAYPTMVGVYFIVRPRLAIALTFIGALVIVPALLNKMEFISLIVVIMTLSVNNLFAYIFSTRMQAQQDQLSMLIRRDPLTGAGNRRALNEKMDELIAVKKRTNQKSSLIVLDIDHFKSINDNYGHSVGDQVLIKLTESINARIRETDCLYRFGGEEFVVVLTGAGIEAASQISEELRLIIESKNLLDGKVVTASFGVAEYIDDESAGDWLSRGDKAMYNAKESGRNRTCISKS